MFIQSKEKLTLSKLSETSSLPRQNYVPFISKCSRFEDPNQRSSKLVKVKVDQKKQESIHALSKSRQKSQERKSPQYFFKSENQRFNNSKVMQTPSPAYYCINSSEKNSESNQIKNTKKILPLIKTIPAIPDSRNKYGYNFEDNNHTLVHKTPQQLQREKYLMKKYQQTLDYQKISQKQAKISSFTHKQRDIEVKVKKILEKLPKIEKQNKISHNVSLCQLTKPKFNHIYEYHPIKETQIPINTKFEKQKNQKQRKTNIKYQFFNSSERRFKIIESQSPPIKQKPSVRDYLSKFVSKTQAS